MFFFYLFISNREKYKYTTYKEKKWKKKNKNYMIKSFEYSLTKHIGSKLVYRRKFFFLLQVIYLEYLLLFYSFFVFS